MEKKSSHLINFHHRHKGFNAVCGSAVNPAFLILQPKRSRIQKIQQGTKNEGECKEARQSQTKNYLLCSTKFQSIKSKYTTKLQINNKHKQR